MNKEKFFDRESYIETIEKRIFALKDGYRQNIAIVGDELVGKTSIIFKLLDRLHDNSIITVYLEGRPESISSFVKRFIAILLYNFLINSGLPLQEDLDFLIKRSEKYIPKTTEKIKSILSAVAKRKKNNIFTELLSLTESIYQETGKSCVIIFDEFQNLENLGLGNLYKDWSKLLISQKNTLYIITSSMKFKTKYILSKDLSLLFGNFEIIEIEPFDIRTAEQYLDLKLKNINLDAGLKDFLVNFTGGYPMYMGVIADAILKSENIKLAETLETLLFDASGILNQRFSNYIKRFLDSGFNNDYISILYLIASGHNKIKDIAHILHKQKKELNTRISHLLELDTITRSADFLKINDRIFGFWLKFVYQEKLQSLTFDAKNQKEKFRDNIEAIIQDYLSYARKPIRERFTEVLNLFEDEAVQMERKKVRLHHFREIKFLEFHNRNIKQGLIGRSQESIWIMAFKQDILTEEDVTEFSKECKKYRHKLQRKIIVTLKDIDSNTRLRALEEKVWAWDINNLNQILDLFSKPRVIA